MVSNLSGSLLNIYFRVRSQEKEEDWLIGTIEYSNNYLQFSQPRRIDFYLFNFSHPSTFPLIASSSTSLK